MGSTVSRKKGRFMRVLCLGATGRLGGMLRRGWRSDTRLKPLWQGRRGIPAGNGIRLDILRDPGALEAACQASDVILCLAGVTPSPDAELSLNTEIALAVQDAAGHRPLLLASSAAVYGRAGGLCREDATPRPAAPYGAAKLAMERAVLARGDTTTCLRIGNVAGADQILGRATKGEPLVLDRFPNGRTPARSYVGPATLARILADLCLAAGAGRALPPVLNLASPGAVEMGALLDAADHPWRPRPAPPEAIAEVRLDTAALGRFTRLDPDAGRPERLVAEWRADRAAMEAPE